MPLPAPVITATRPSNRCLCCSAPLYPDEEDGPSGTGRPARCPRPLRGTPRDHRPGGAPRLAPRVVGDEDRLGVGERVQRVRAQLAADTGLLEPAERGPVA